jgi:D-3-phosphoglycerate dehydrogenase
MTNDKTIFLGPSYYRTLLPDGYELLAKNGYSLLENNTDSPISPLELRDLGHDLHGAVVGMEKWDAEAMDAHPGLKILTKCGVGIDKIDIQAAAARGIAVTNTPGMNSNAVAEVAIGLMIGVLRQLPSSQAAAKNGHRIVFNGPELTGKTVGLIGMGGVGRRLVQRLQGFDVSILVYDPYYVPRESEQQVFELAALETVLKSSDIVSLHTPLTPETHHMINAAALAQFKPGSYLINTARGGLVDEAALLNALRSGHLAGAGLDVFEQEPVDPNNELLALENVLGTTHLGANSFEAASLVGLANANAIIAVFEGAQPQHKVS